MSALLRSLLFALFEMATLNAIHDKMHRAVGQAGGRIDAVFYCPHAMEANCGCRKPKPGLLEDIGRRFNTDLTGVPVIGDALRDLQAAGLLADLLEAVKNSRARLRNKHGRNVALALKISPDLDDAAIRAIAAVAIHKGIDGIVATNTTVSRDGVESHPNGVQAGGLSGAPLRERATRVVKVLADALQGELPVIGVGGILSGADAVEKLDAGASLVQLYSGLIYRGPELVSECVSACLERSRTASTGSR